jgi:unsaturated chondroitin disaccharide hydrolase
MNRIYMLLLALLSIIVGFAQQPLLQVDNTLVNVQQHLARALSTHTNTSLYPRTYSYEQSLVTVKSSDWTSGFFPGILWYVYEYTHDPKWKMQAERWTAGWEKEKNNTTTHDLGFMLYCSFGNGYRLTQNPRYKKILLQAAMSLASRYHPTVGCIRSWDHGTWKYPVIIDNMMNLELLFWASENSGDPTFYQIAVNHATHTMKNHYRKDGSAYHVIDYDVQTGRVISRTTHQGYADESAWARGQAWGLYGFTMTYVRTKDKIYLNHAEKIAHYFISHLPKNKIPYWDFSAPLIPFEVQDASAAAIAASALIELSMHSEQSGSHYLKTAEAILNTLHAPSFFARENTNGNFFLMNGVGNKPGNSEINVPLIYADYYFLEALLRYNALKK